jgi:glucokinase
LAIDLGGTKIAAAVMDRAGRLAHLERAPTPAAAGRNAVLAAAGDLAERVRAHSPDVAAVGVGATGLVDAARGEIVYAGGHMPGWTGAPVAAALAARLGLPVAVDNDLNALALGLARTGPAQGRRCVLVLAVGTGVGAALVFAGRVWRGASWSAGEIGHVAVAYGPDARLCNCGQRGHLEAYASGPAIERAYAEQVGGGLRPDLREIAARARTGDRLAQTTIEAAGVLCGQGVSGVVGVLDPELLVVGGGVSAIGPLWRQPFETGLRQSPLPGPRTVPVEVVSFGLDAALQGAGWLAFTRLDETHSAPAA